MAESSKTLGNPPATKDADFEDLQSISFEQLILGDQIAVDTEFLKIEICNPETNGRGRNRYIDYEVKMSTNIPVFKYQECSVRRRYRDFLWLKNELERDTRIRIPPFPGKAWKLQLPFRRDDGLLGQDFIEHRRRGLENFINKIASHPLAQNEKCLHVFLQDLIIDRNYTPGKVRKILRVEEA